MISEVQSRIQRVNCRVKSENRLPSLDVFRGLAIICMLLVNSLPDFEHAYPLLLHSEWAGITLADLAFPGFIFAMGASGTFFFGKHQHESFAEKFMLILRRGFVFFVLGIVINQFELVLSHVMHTAPEGLYGSLAATSSMLLGLLAGQRLTARNLVGKYKEPQENYDLINIVMVYLAPGPVRNKTLSMLQVIFQETDMTAEEKSEILRKKFDIEVTAEMEEELRTMCNLSEGIYERGAENKTIEIIQNLWNKGMDVDFIKDVTNWTEEKIMKVEKKDNN